MNSSPTQLILFFTLRRLAAAGLFCSAVQAGALEDALARMDKSAYGFRSLTATVAKTSYTALIKESTRETGRITLMRAKPHDLRFLVEITDPDPRAVAFQKQKFQVYMPKVQTVQEYDLGKQSSLVDEFLLLGFGSPGSELRKSYELQYLGAETIDGVQTDRLLLTPRSKEAKNSVRNVEIWVSQADGLAVKQKVNQPSNDYVLFEYSNMKVNPPINEDAVKLKLPKGVKRETPQR